MMLASLIRMDPLDSSVCVQIKVAVLPGACQKQAALLLQNCESHAHEGQASRNELRGQFAWYGYQGADLAPIRGGWGSKAPCKQRAAAAKTAEADFHADVGDGIIAECEEMLGAFEAWLNAKLVRRRAEDR